MAEGGGYMVSYFILRALKDEERTIYENGTQVRSFYYADDLVAA